MTVQSHILGQMAGEINANKASHHPHELMELSEFELESLSGGGWFKKLTGISTPKFLKDLDDSVRANVKGGWLGVFGKVVGMAYGGGGITKMLN